ALKLARSWRRSRLQIEIDVVGDEQVQMPVAIVVEKGAACAPLRVLAQETRPFRNVRKSAVTVVVIENVLAPVHDKKVVKAVVVVVADADALAPAEAGQSGLLRHVLEGAVAIVAQQPIGRDRLSASQSSTIHKKDIEPAVVVVIEEGRAATGSLDDVLVLRAAAVDGWRGEPSPQRHVLEAHGKRAGGAGH